VVVLVVVALAYVASIALARSHSGANVTNPSASGLAVIENLFPPRTLSANDATKAGATCVEGNDLVVATGSSCTFVVPKGVNRVELDSVAGSGPMTVTLARAGGLTQSVDTGQKGPDAKHPGRVRLAVTGDGSVLTAQGCTSGTCRVRLGS
jgi:hypothetical protein